MSSPLDSCEISPSQGTAPELILRDATAIRAVACLPLVQRLAAISDFVTQVVYFWIFVVDAKHWLALSCKLDVTVT